MAWNISSFAQGWRRPTISTMGPIDLVLLTMYVCYIPNCLGLLQLSSCYVYGIILSDQWLLRLKITIQPLWKHAMITSQRFTSPQRYGYSKYWKRCGSCLGQMGLSFAPQCLCLMENCLSYFIEHCHRLHLWQIGVDYHLCTKCLRNSSYDQSALIFLIIPMNSATLYFWWRV